MRKLTYTLSVAAATAMLAGCWGAPQGIGAAVPSQVVSSDPAYAISARELAATGIDPRYINAIESAPIVHSEAVGQATCRGSWQCGNLYVSDIGARAVKALSNDSYTPKGSVFARSPDGVWSDTAHNLYVANVLSAAGNGYIQEHACTVQHCNTKPDFLYKSNMVDPVAVTTDRRGNVYAVDYLVGNIAEFPQHVDRESASCALLGNPEGIAVDSATGNVFVSFNRLGAGLIIEFPHKLAPCDGRVLGAHLGFAGGIVLDPDKKLVVADQQASEVDVISPPYDRIDRKCGSGFVDPGRVALTKVRPRLYVADPASASVHVYTYPACSPLTTLSGPPLVVPLGVTDSYNFVP